jgi:alpha-L-fucosidase
MTSPLATTAERLASRALPNWYEDAKLGIFVHWGPASVPGWAPRGRSMAEVLGEGGFEPDRFRELLLENPYADWYWNGLALEGSATRAYHDRSWGADVGYEAFVERFRSGLSHWDPAAWADLFQRAGAHYVVLVTKHHDGFLLWPSRHENPFRVHWQCERDLVGELAEAVRARGMRMGVYYSGGIDWTFGGLPVRDMKSLLAGTPQSEAYATYADAHWRELIERYRPSVLWNDIGYPRAAAPLQLFADYYSAVPDGVVNNRFMVAGYAPEERHADFQTPEYSVPPGIRPSKWEATRGIGHSFAFNRNEADEAHLSAAEAIHLLVDAVAKNGNLLLNVGPRSDGRIPWLQQLLLESLGSWLDVCGEAIFGTRPWTRAEGSLEDGTPVRFTRRADALYAIVLGPPRQAEVVLRDLAPRDGSEIHLLGHPTPATWQRRGSDVALSLPESGSGEPAYALRLRPTPC